MEFLTLPKRTKKERDFGITSIADFGTPIGELEHILKDYHEYIDIAKMGIGSAYVTPNTKRKVDLYKGFNIKPYCGGTLFEKCFYQRKVPDYIRYLQKLNIEWIEISCGTLEIPITSRAALIKELKADFHIIGEVGSKDSSIEMPVNAWQEEINRLFEAGCEYVITEGRDSGTSGIYGKNGELKKDLINNMLKNIDYRKVIFEAPTAKSQMYFINEFGTNVNLGNVKLQDVLALEAERQGLRSETFYLEEGSWNLQS
jgi:phosphosulfolactate synthase